MTRLLAIAGLWVLAACGALSEAEPAVATTGGIEVSGVLFNRIQKDYDLVGNWSDGPVAYRLYAPRNGTGSKNIFLCQIVPTRGSAFAPRVNCTEKF